MRITKNVPERIARATVMGTRDETSAHEPRRGWEMDPLCYRKYKEAARPK